MAASSLAPMQPRPQARPLLETRALHLPRFEGRGGAPLTTAPIALSLAAGDRLQLTGPSGSGKTTTLRALAGLEALASGALFFEGSEVTAAGMPAYRQQLLYLPQQPPALGASAWESLQRASSFRKTSCPTRASAESLASDLLLEAALLDQKPDDLSVGEAQRVALLRALLLQPQVLLLDEPTSALDPASSEVACSALMAWHDAGPRAFILVTHDAALGRRLCNRSQALIAPTAKAP